MNDYNFEFVPPPEAPFFEPSQEDFEDPLAYIAKIKPIAEKTGICRIRPPKDWKPPFAVDFDNFKFKARVQRLYELEAQSRVKCNFIFKLSQFMKLQGREALRIPNVLGRYLDLYMLHKMVAREGGYDQVCKDKKWAHIGNMLGYAGNRVAYSLKGHYDKLLLPYDFMLGSAESERYRQILQAKLEKKNASQRAPSKRKRMSYMKNLADIDYSANKELHKLQFFGAGPKAAVPENLQDQESEENTQTSIPSEDIIKEGETLNDLAPLEETKTGLKRKSPSIYSLPKVSRSTKKELEDYVCNVCQSGDDEDLLLICDSPDCQECYHTYCLIPPLPHVPKTQWKCPPCILETCSKPPEEFGFAESLKEYTLAEFGQQADQFKTSYFKKPEHSISCSEVEHEFWRILQSFNEEVNVEYGADIHSSKLGSGFPTQANLSSWKSKQGKIEDAKAYAKAPWNLNVLPVLEKSVLRFITANINGMKVPWCYVGMIFSSFCWHIEDHWSYSINYLHWGRPKTWYGVSSEQAVAFELAMRRIVPELFEHAPDLLHHITTIMNPNQLQKEGVDICRTDQQPGDFIVTFPRAYHAGFNQGFNFAEAVNFCPADWIPMGRACIEHYAYLKRHCVFSHDELILNMARSTIEDENSMDVNIRDVLWQELSRIVTREKQYRAEMLQHGLHRTEAVKFEEFSDDDRVCDSCNTTCYVSAISCSCVERLENESSNSSETKNRMVCLEHTNDLCSCDWSNRVLKYRFTPKELIEMLDIIEKQQQDYHKWLEDLEPFLHLLPNNQLSEQKKTLVIKNEFTTDLSSILPESTSAEIKPASQEKPSYYSLKMHLDEGKRRGFHVSDRYQQFDSLCDRADRLADLCTKFLYGLRYTDKVMENEIIVVTEDLPEKSEDSQLKREFNITRLTLSDLEILVTAIQNLPFSNVGEPAFGELRQIVNRVPTWQVEVNKLLKDHSVKQFPQIEALCKEGLQLGLVLPQFQDLAKLGKGLGWCYHVDNLFPELKLLEEMNETKSRRRAMKRDNQGSFKADSKSEVNKMDYLSSKSEEEKPSNKPERKRMPSMRVLQQVLQTGRDLLKCLDDENEKFTSLCARLHSRLGSLHTKLTEVERLRKEILDTIDEKLFDYDELVGMIAECQSLNVHVSELSKLKHECWTMWTKDAAEMLPGQPKLYRTFSITWFEKLFNLGVQLCNEGVLKSDPNIIPDESTKNLKFTHDMVRLAHRFRAKVATEFLPGSPHCLGAAADTRLLTILMPRSLKNDAVSQDMVSHFIELIEGISSLCDQSDAINETLRYYQSCISTELLSWETRFEQSKVYIENFVWASPFPVDYVSLLNNRCALCFCDIRSAVELSPESKGMLLLCSSCQRSRRPKLSRLVVLNAELSQLPVRLYESFAMHGLRKRTLNWLNELEEIFQSHSCLWSFVLKLNSKNLIFIPQLLLKICSSPQEDKTCSNCEFLTERLLRMYMEGLLLEVDLSDYWRFLIQLFLEITPHNIKTNTKEDAFSSQETSVSVTNLSVEIIGEERHDLSSDSSKQFEDEEESNSVIILTQESQVSSEKTSESKEIMESSFGVLSQESQDSKVTPEEVEESNDEDNLDSSLIIISQESQDSNLLADEKENSDLCSSQSLSDADQSQSQCKTDENDKPASQQSTILDNNTENNSSFINETDLSQSCLESEDPNVIVL